MPAVELLVRHSWNVSVPSDCLLSCSCMFALEILGIFPEGGSHDRTDLLPLKVGVALIAYSALEKDGINVPIVPVGLNYFRAHRWRGRAVVEVRRGVL